MADGKICLASGSSLRSYTRIKSRILHLTTSHAIVATGLALPRWNNFGADLVGEAAIGHYAATASLFLLSDPVRI